jgi:hypothetical protein
MGSSLAYRRSQRVGKETKKRATYLKPHDIESETVGLVQLLQLLDHQHQDLTDCQAWRQGAGRELTSTVLLGRCFSPCFSRARM